MNVIFAAIIGGFSLGQAVPNVQYFTAGSVAGRRLFDVIARQPEIDIDAEGIVPDSDLTGAPTSLLRLDGCNFTGAMSRVQCSRVQFHGCSSCSIFGTSQYQLFISLHWRIISITVSMTLSLLLAAGYQCFWIQRVAAWNPNKLSYFHLNIRPRNTCISPCKFRVLDGTNLNARRLFFIQFSYGICFLLGNTAW